MIKKFIAISMLAFASLTAQAKVIGVIPFQNGGFINLEAGNTRCVKLHKEARDGTYTYPNQKTIKGCWIATPDGIWFADEEGDSGMLPLAAVQKPNNT